MHEPPGLDDNQAVGDGCGVERVVGDQDTRPAELAEVVAELVSHRSSGRYVERGHGLVEQEKSRVGGQGPGQGHPLGLATGQLTRLGLGLVAQLHPVEPLEGPPVGLGLGLASAPETEGHVGDSGEVGEE